MQSLVKWARDYYQVTAAAAVIVIAGGLQLGGLSVIAGWLISAFSLIMAAQLAIGMVRTLRSGRYGIDILAIMAIISTIVVGEYWATIVIVLMLTGGEALEDYAAARAKRELTGLLARAPQTATLITATGNRVVPIATIQSDDRLLLRPGEVVPVDAVILEGTSDFDESSLTGESLPVEKQPGDQLLSGSINGAGVVTIRALRTAKNSQYEQIIELVRSAGESDAPFVRLADRYAVPFTLISLAIAAVAWAASGQALRFAEVLVVATPCPLLLGAPIALISGMSRAAKHGIIVKTGATLEKLARIKTAAFDKTGTLTTGQPNVGAVHPEKGVDQTTLLTLAASAESQSSHILARALVAHAVQQKVPILPAKNAREHTAAGIRATVDGQVILVGKADFLRAQHVRLPKTRPDQTDTAVYVARGKTYIGRITFADKVRPNSKITLERMRGLGVSHFLMLTGDNQATARAIAKRLAIDEVHAECLPKNKLDIVRAERQRPVMMVGDGVNDAPVLAVSEVGVAMGAKGSTAASESADVVIMLDDISRVVLMLQIAKDTIRIALQSIVVGIIISVALMIVASTGVIPAVVGAGLQEVVDVVVIFNALRAHGSWRPS